MYRAILVSSVLLGTGCLAAEAITPEQRTQSKSVGSSYILGPGDTLKVEIFNLPEISGDFSVGPDGILYLPRLRAVSVEGLTVSELEYFLTAEYKQYIKDPQVFITPVEFRSVRVYVGGEIARPGYYLLSTSGNITNQVVEEEKTRFSSVLSMKKFELQASSSEVKDAGINSKRWPTLFDAIQAARGSTPYSDLSKVTVVRKVPLSEGGGKAKAIINFFDLITSGDESVNIRLFDGDTISVEKSEVVLREQLLKASRSNLSAEFIEVFVSGRVKEPGPHVIPQGSTLNQAIASAGGTSLLKGGVEFVRFSQQGTTDRRRFGYKPTAPSGDYKNPVLMSGDVIRVNDSLLSAGVQILNEVTGPAVGIFSVYSLFK